MAGKKINELVQANTVTDNDLFIVETANGTCSIPYSEIKRLFQNMLEVNAGETQSFPFVDCAASHNGIFRGKDLTNIYTIDEICERISNGTFEDLYIGDYFDVTISTEYTENEVVRCILAGFDTYWGTGSGLGVFTNHHAVIVPKNCFNKIAPMNQTSTTTGGFANSYMRKTVLPIYENALKSAINNHIIEHKEILANAVDENLNSNAGAGIKGASSGCISCYVRLSLLSEIQIYGSNIRSSSFYDTGYDNLQLPLFALDPKAKLCGKNTTIDGNGDDNLQWYWLKNVVSVDTFAYTTNYSYNFDNASYNGGVRPLFCIG